MVLKKVIKKIFVFLNYLSALLLLLVYLSVFIKPVNYWPAAFFGLAYPYILAFNLVFALYWLYRRKKYLFISLIVVLIGWKHVGSIFRVSFHPVAKEKPADLKILSYNIKLLKLYNYNQPGDKAIIDLIQNEKPGMICFQENFVKHGSAIHIPLALQNQFELKNCIIQRGNAVTNYGMAILSKYPLLNKGEIHFDNTLNFCLFGDYLINEDTVRFYNIHLQSIKFGDHDFMMMDSIARFENQNRYKQIKDISKKLTRAFKKRSVQVEIVKQHINSSPYKTIICGDFNDTPVSYTYHHLSKSLFDAYREKGSGIGNTYISKKLAYRIDYIFHDDSFETAWYKKPKIKSSDHYPVMAGINFRE